MYSRLPNVYEQTVSRTEQVVHVTMNNQDKGSDIHIHVFYRSPNSTPEMNDAVLKYLSSIPGNSVLIRDFNSPEIDWSTLSSVLPTLWSAVPRCCQRQISQPICSIPHKLHTST